MRYVLLVSHGEFAPGLQKAIEMLAGSNREDLLATSLKNGMGADEFAVQVRELLAANIGEGDEIAMYADIVGGSPLTTAANVIAEMGLLDRTVMVGGMNLPLVLSTLLAKDFAEDYGDFVRNQMIPEASSLIQEFKVEVEEESDEI